MERSKEIASLVALRSLDYEVDATAKGVLVTGVFPDTPASGRLREGDVVVAADGRRVRTLDELRAAVGAYEPRRRIVLSVRRRDHTQRIRVGTIQDPRAPSRGFMGIRVDQAADIELPIDVEIDLGRVGGPSAGLPFALEIVRQLGGEITGGCVVAATGAITFDGTVVSVGGIPQKAIAARSAGVDAFLVPIGPNAAEARSHANGLRIIAVANFQQALRKLATTDLKC
jgi:Lon-like protease